MTVSVVICHYGAITHTLHAMNSVPAGVELIVVDNDGGLRSLRTEATVIRPARNLGFAAGCNLGARAASGEFVIFFNNDAYTADPLWIDKLLAPFDDQEVGIVGARLVYPDGRLQHAGVAVDFSRPPGQEAWNILEDHPACQLVATTGACMAVRSAVFAQLGGFDEGYWNGYEDVDLCLAAAAHGIRIRYNPAVTIHHLESASGPERWTAVADNITRLRRKWS